MILKIITNYIHVYESVPLRYESVTLAFSIINSKFPLKGTLLFNLTTRARQLKAYWILIGQWVSDYRKFAVNGIRSLLYRGQLVNNRKGY